MFDTCRECTFQSWIMPGDPVDGGLRGHVEPGHLFPCVCAVCGCTVVDHEGRCLGVCEVEHGDLPVPFTEVTVPNDYRLA